MMRAKTKTAILVLLPLLMLGLIACGSDKGAATSQVGDATDGAQSVAIVDGDHDDGDAHEVAITDEHDDGDEHVALDDHDAESTALAEHDETTHSDMVLDTHEDEASEAGGHAHSEATVDPDAPVVHFFASEFGYETITTEVEAGLAFTIQLHNEGVLEHDITIEGLEGQGGIHLQPGEDDMATFEIHEPGEYVYYCTIPGHREAGMTGTLLVTGALVAADEDGHADDHDDGEATHEDDDHVEAAAGA